MDIYKEPIGNTCPQIDYIRSCINDAVKECKKDYYSIDIAKDGFSDVLYFIEDIPNELERLRDANRSLRDWGNALLDKVRELESENERLSEIISNIE